VSIKTKGEKINFRDTVYKMKKEQQFDIESFKQGAIKGM